MTNTTDFIKKQSFAGRLRRMGFGLCIALAISAGSAWAGNSHLTPGQVSFRDASTDSLQSDQLGAYVNGVMNVVAGLTGPSMILDTNTTGTTALRTVSINFSSPVPNSLPNGTTPQSPWPGANKFDALLTVTLPAMIQLGATVVVPMELDFVPPVANGNQYTLKFSQVLLSWTSLHTWVVEAPSGSIATLQCVSLKGKTTTTAEGSFYIPFQFVMQMLQ